MGPRPSAPRRRDAPRGPSGPGRADFPARPPYGPRRALSSTHRACPLPRPPVAQTRAAGAGILTCRPSTTPFGLALGPTSPGRIILPQEPSGFRWRGFPPRFYATHSGIRSRHPSTRAPARASPAVPTLPYHSLESAASAAGLSPGTFSAHDHWTSELLRTRSRVAASKPTSWLSARSHILVH